MAEELPAHPDELEPLDVGSEPVCEADEVRQIIQAERVAEERSRRRGAAAHGITIGGHVKAPPVLLKARAIEASRRSSSSALTRSVIDAVALSLLGGVADRSEWSADVRRALWVFEDAADGARLRARKVPWAMEQLRAAARIRRERLIHLSVLRKRGAPLPPLDDYQQETETMVEGEVLYVAQRVWMLAAAEVEERAREAVEQRAPPRRGRRPKQPEPRTILDGRWHGGHPDEHIIYWRLLQTEVWRDVRAELRQAEGRVSRSEALAEVLLEEMRDSDSSGYRRIDNLRRELEADGCRSAAALARAMTALRSQTFKAIQVRFSQVLKGCPPDTIRRRPAEAPAKPPRD